jgi:hypothetical protein
LAHLNPTLDQRRLILLAETNIPSLDEIISGMIQDERRMRLHSKQGGLSGARSTLVTLSPDMIGAQIETHKCYNYGEVGHLSKACPKSSKKREVGGRGQPRGCGRGCRGLRGDRGGGYQANLMVEPQVEEKIGITAEEYKLFEMLKRK